MCPSQWIYQVLLLVRLTCYSLYSILDFSHFLVDYFLIYIQLKKSLCHTVLWFFTNSESCFHHYSYDTEHSYFPYLSFCLLAVNPSLHLTLSTIDLFLVPILFLSKMHLKFIHFFAWIKFASLYWWIASTV